MLLCGAAPTTLTALPLPICSHTTHVLVPVDDRGCIKQRRSAGRGIWLAGRLLDAYTFAVGCLRAAVRVSAAGLSCYHPHCHSCSHDRCHSPPS